MPEICGRRRQCSLARLRAYRISRAIDTVSVALTGKVEIGTPQSSGNEQRLLELGQRGKVVDGKVLV